MAKMLDKTARFGTLHPIENRVAFSQMQNGAEMYFDQEGYPVDVATGARLPVEAAPSTPIVAAVEDDDDVNKPDPIIDLLAWAREEIKAPWATVQEAVMAAYGHIPTSKQEARDYIFGDERE